MITECYIKGRYDNGVGKCAVVIVESGNVIHQTAWIVPESWMYSGHEIKADQYNCEILAATYAIKWCTDNKKPLVNIYSNLSTCSKWYMFQEFPETRKAAAIAYVETVDRYYEELDKDGAAQERIYAEWIPKDCDEARYANFNYLVNYLAENVK